MEKASTKFEIIHTALQKEDNQLDIQTMCQLEVFPGPGIIDG